MNRLFISKISYFKIALSSFIIFVTLPVFLFLIWLIALAIFLYLRRSACPNYKDGLAVNPDLFFSPISGKVKWTDLEKREVCLTVSLLSGLGVYFPCPAKVEDFKLMKLDRSRMSGFTNRRNRYNLTLRSSRNELVHLELEPLLLNFRSFVLAGDRAKMSACMGYLPIGGKVKITFPSEIKLLVAEGETLKAGETVLAGT